MPVTDELKKLYGAAQEIGLHIREFPSDKGFMAYVGSKHKLANAGFETKEDRKKMDLFQCNLYMTPHAAATREEAVEGAIQLYRRTQDWIPNE